MSMTTLKAWREVLDTSNQQPEVLKPQCLLKLYDLLISLSLDPISQCPGEKLTDVRKISNFLFEELSKRFSHLNVGQGILCSDSWDLFQDLTLFLLIEKCQILLTMLGKLCSPELASYVGRKERNVVSVKESTTRECTIATKDCITSVIEEYETFMFYVQKSGALIPVLRSIIEVFINEFLGNKKLVDYFTMVESISSTTDKLFMCPLNLGSSNVVLELIFSHFLLSVSDEPTFKNSLEAVLPLCDEKPPFLDLISLNAAMQLLSTTRELVYFSFEISMDLYSQNMSSLQSGDDHEEPKSGYGFSDKPLHMLLRPAMYSQLKFHTTNFAKSSHGLALKTKSDIMNACTAYMKQNQNILNESYRDECFSFFCNIISRILSGDMVSHKLWKKRNIINLIPLLQTIWSMQKPSFGNLRMLKDYSQCKEYDIIVSIISCFQQFIISQLMETLVLDMMAHYPSRHKYSKVMFMHFAGLLLFSFEAGLEVLSKGCIFMLMILMNLFIFEEGNLDAPKPAPHLEDKSLSSRPLNKSLVVFAPRSPSLLVASNFQKFQRSNIRINEPIQSEASRSILISECVDQFDLSTKEENRSNYTCKGNKCLKCKEVLGKNRPPDYDTDFVECKKGKDYSKWQKDKKEA
ncbi:hypothetical protein MKX01_029531 [Papaver californicum]|nr:hypothetical protein MKX01_029531 [Papaver californicum]